MQQQEIFLPESYKNVQLHDLTREAFVRFMDKKQVRLLLVSDTNNRVRKEIKEIADFNKIGYMELNAWLYLLTKENTKDFVEIKL